MAGTRRLSELVSGAGDRLRLPPGPVVVALSGGADSACLAHLAIHSGREVSAIHVNHSMAGSAKLEEAARAIAAKLDFRLDVATVELSSGPSPEERAREARYSVLTQVEDSVLTGHTQEDDAETVLLNLIRGTGPAGLSGIPAHRPPNVFRPLLEVTRSETREIATLVGLPYVDDPMNHDLDLTRNRVRLRVLPEMTAINPDVVMAITRAANAIRSDVELLDSLTPGQGASLATSVVAVSPPALGDRMILEWLDEVGVERSAAVVARVRSLVDGSAPRQDLTGGKAAVRRGPLIVIE